MKIILFLITPIMIWAESILINIPLGSISANISCEQLKEYSQLCKTYPQIIHKGDQGKPVRLINRIVDINNQPIKNIEVKLIGDKGWEYIALTNDEGIFEFNVTDRDEFKLYAWNGTVWAEYTYKLSINVFNNFFEKDINGMWQGIKPNEWHPIKVNK